MKVKIYNYNFLKFFIIFFYNFVKINLNFLKTKEKLN
jgi:hypothetical protein